MSGVTPAFRRAWLGLTLLLALVIIVFSLTPQGLTPQAAGNDKLNHAIAYFALSLMAAGVSETGSLWRVAGYCFGLGALLEILQGAVTVDRTADWNDLAASSAGIFTAWLLLARGGACWARYVSGWLARRRQP